MCKLILANDVDMLNRVIEDSTILANPVVVNLRTLCRKAKILNLLAILQEDLNIGRIRNPPGTGEVFSVFELQSPLRALRITLGK